MAENQLMKSGHHATFEGDRAQEYVELQRKYMIKDFQHFANQIVTKIKKGRILHLGSGGGFLSIAIAQKSPEYTVVGLDSSRTMIELAEVNSSLSGVSSQIEFIYWDTLKLPVGDEDFDFATSIWELHHWQKPVSVLNEVFRVLKKGSRGMIIDLRRNTPEIELKKLTDNTPAFIYKGLKAHLPLTYFPIEIKDILLQTKFDEFQVEEEGVHVTISLYKK
ncbi:MAG: class I SAM-dependent methyltransferase [bacterium]